MRGRTVFPDQLESTILDLLQVARIILEENNDYRAEIREETAQLTPEPLREIERRFNFIGNLCFKRPTLEAKMYRVSFNLVNP